MRSLKEFDIKFIAEGGDFMIISVWRESAPAARKAAAAILAKQPRFRCAEVWEKTLLRGTVTAWIGPNPSAAKSNRQTAMLQ